MNSVCQYTPIALLMLSWVACSGESELKPTDCRLEVGSVIYEEGELGVDVIATVTDSSGKAVKEVLVTLASDRDGDAVEPAVATTGADGRAFFWVWTRQDGTASLRASLMDSSAGLGPAAQVDFGLQLLLIAGETEPTNPGASVTLSAQVSDDVGAVEGAALAISSNRGSIDIIDPASQESAPDGTATFEASTMQEGSATFTLQMEGLTLSNLPSREVFFGGPTLSGQWSFPQPGGVVNAPRVGLLWVQFGLDSIPEQELISAAIDPVPEWDDTGSYSIQLPLQVPRADLYHPDPDNPELPDSFRIAPYLMLIYDLDDSGEFTYPDQFLTVLHRESVSLLVYFEGEMPDPSVLPNVAPGYNFMTMVAGQDDPVFIPWDQQTDEADLDIRCAPCLSGPMGGRVTFRNSLDPSSDTRVAVLMLDAHLTDAGFGEEVFYQGNFLELVSTDVAFTPNATQAYELNLPDPAEIDPGYTGFLVDIDSPGTLRAGVMVPLVYIDSDGDDIYTNIDDDLNTGDLIVGSSYSPFGMPFGYGMVMLWWFEGEMNPVLSSIIPGVNQGYNILHEPLKNGVVAVVDDNTLELNSNIEPGHVWLPFKIVREIAGEQTVVLQGDDLATGDTQDRFVTSASGGFTIGVQPGDDLVITNQIEAATILDLDTPTNLGTL